MGSRKEEPGWSEWEGPVHWVRLADGFWLFDTPCTQALWEALTGDNPSGFKSPNRPVETVSWEGVQRFLERLNCRMAEHGSKDQTDERFALPSEAQWEYACRAGTEMALYSGAIEILGERHAPALDPIAWYGGNSGVDFELDDGCDSSGWEEPQYPKATSGTHPVRGKQPNDLGLFDMLGNVWEWTQDAWHRGYAGAPDDGSPREIKDAALRVIRGGSWYDPARLCRSACRRAHSPHIGGDGLGFRPARTRAT